MAMVELTLNTAGDQKHEKAFFANHAIQYRLISDTTERKITKGMYANDKYMSLAYNVLRKGLK